MQKLLTFFFSKNISVYAIVNDQTFNDTLTKNIVSFKQMSPDCYLFIYLFIYYLFCFVFDKKLGLIFHVNRRRFI